MLGKGHIDDCNTSCTTSTERLSAVFFIHCHVLMVYVPIVLMFSTFRCFFLYLVASPFADEFADKRRVSLRRQMYFNTSPFMNYILF